MEKIKLVKDEQIIEVLKKYQAKGVKWIDSTLVLPEDLHFFRRINGLYKMVLLINQSNRLCVSFKDYIPLEGETIVLNFSNYKISE